MEPPSPSLSRRRLRAPQSSGATLLVPSLADACQLASANRARDARPWPEIGGLAGERLIHLARRELLALGSAGRLSSDPSDRLLQAAAARAVPLILSGHQPQLFHPGVWYKNFVAAQLAAQAGGVAIHFLADGDISAAASLRVPAGSRAAPRWEEIPYDRPGEAIPWECRTVRDASLCASFGARAAATLRPFVPDPLLLDYWPRVQHALVEFEGNLGRALARARHEIEHAWGLRTLEVSLGQLCEGEAFRRLLLHLVRQAPQLADTYNQAVAEYRRVYKVRSKAHPVPDLARDANGCEVPLWVWSMADPRRRRLFAGRRAGQLELTDRAGWALTLPATDEAALAALAAASAGGLRLRPRALLTTLFARLFLSDLFIHGIGGGMYDQVTDLLIRRWLGIEPPGYVVATSTLLLTCGAHRPPRDELQRIDRLLRELTWDPQRALAGSSDPAVQRLIAAKQRAIAGGEPAAPAGPARHAAIRAVNAALQPYVEPLRAALLAHRAEAQESVRRAALLGSREFAFILHSEKNLREHLLALPAATP